jgi:hypothetical protein
MFLAEYRRIIDNETSAPLRYIKFLHCIEFYSWLTGLGFSATYIRLGSMYGFDWENKPGKEQVIEAITHLKRERDLFLIKLQKFKEVRRKEKAQGKKRPSPEQYRNLYSPDWIQPKL